MRRVVKSYRDIRTLRPAIYDEVPYGACIHTCQTIVMVGDITLCATTANIAGHATTRKEHVAEAVETFLRI